MNRIKWRDFVGTTIHKLVGDLLWVAGYELVVVFDDQKEATDVFIQKR